MMWNRSMFGLGLTVVMLLGISSARVAAQATGPNCGIPPIGVLTSSTDPEPQQPIWCESPLSPQPTTAVLDQFGGLVDDFNHNDALGGFHDGDMGYHVFDAIEGPTTAVHFIDNNYFILDMAKESGMQGAAISPMQKFFFENGKLVIEADVAAGTAAFHDSSGGDITWAEVTWSTGAAPGGVNDGLYLYGQFQGFTTGGCRLQSPRSLTCSVQADHVLSSVTNDQPPCFSVSPSRVMEISGFQDCGSVHSGMSVDFGAPSNAWRVCQTNQVDECLDRFRFEWSKTGLVMYVNGIKFGEDSGWPTNSQLPDSVVSGAVPVYVYFGSFGDFADPNVYRFHWQRIAVNPHDASGNILAPSASPTFGQQPPPAALTISNVQASQIATSSATISWATNNPASSQVEYGPTTAYGSTSPLDSTLVTNHLVGLSGLNASTTYHYRVDSQDANGNVASSPDQTFTTATVAPPPPNPGTLLVGDKAIESSGDNNPPGMAEAFQYTAAVSGMANSLNVYLDSTNAAQTVLVGIYTDNAATNSPGVLITQGIISNPTAGAWNSVSIPATSISANTIYWIAVLGPAGTGQIQFRDRGTGGLNETSAQTDLTSLPATWTTGTVYFNAPMSAFASE